MQEEEATVGQINRRDAKAFGDTKAFEKVYGDHFGRVRSFLRIYLGNSPVVDDVAQETFLQFWQRPNGFDPSRSTVRAYLFGIARKKAADWWRQQRTAGAASSEASCGDGSQTLLLKDALDLLDPDLRNVLWLREVEGYSYDELAHILDIPVGTVKSRLFSAREQLRRDWKSL
jgi:RNA polymerase sigma-70 factor, ECF subfamily